MSPKNLTTIGGKTFEALRQINNHGAEYSPDHHFAGAGKPIAGGKGAVQTVEDYHLSRFACHIL